MSKEKTFIKNKLLEIFLISNVFDFERGSVFIYSSSLFANRMEKEFNREEKIFIKLLNERVIEKPSVDFKNSVMMRIKANQASVRSYKPLISRKVWYLLSIALVLAVGGLYFQFNENNNNLMGTFEFIKWELFIISFTDINLSKTMKYGISFVAFFYFQNKLFCSYCFCKIKGIIETL